MSDPQDVRQRRHGEGSAIDAAAEMKRIRTRVRRETPLGSSSEVNPLADQLERVRASWKIEPLSFRSAVPVIGPLIAAFRTAWNSVAAKWQVQHLLEQQNRSNLMVYRLLRDLAQRSQQLSAALDGVAERLDELDLRLISAHSLMTAAASSASPRPPGEEEPESAVGPSPSSGCDYLGFNARFTAPGSVVRETYRQYVPLFADRDGVLDAGCGRGHFLELLEEIGVDGYGVDIDPEMVEMCRLKGLEAQVGDAVAHLSELPGESLDGIFSGHLIEHLGPPALHRFLDRAYGVLRPGGILVCETPNTRSLFVLANTFYRDLTHRRPVHPETYQFMAQAAGFGDVELRYSLPVHGEQGLEAIPVSDDADSEIRTAVHKLNKMLRRIDELVFGYQNVAVVARKGDEAS